MFYAEKKSVPPVVNKFCDGCGMFIVNYKGAVNFFCCENCSDYNLCMTCYSKRSIYKDMHEQLHDQTHKFAFCWKNTTTKKEIAASDIVPSFTDKLLKTLCENSEKEGFAFSMPSIESVLANSAVAARGTTQDEIKKLLTQDSSNNSEDLSKKFAVKQAALKLAGGETLKIANAIVFGIPLGDTFKKTAAALGIELIEGVVKSDDSNSVKHLADEFVFNNSGHMIPNSGLEGNISMALINTIYYKAKFKKDYTFDKDDTYSENFRSFSEDQHSVKMMVQTKILRTLCTDKYQAVKIPFEVEDFNLVIVLPHEAGKNALHGLNVSEILEKCFTYNKITVKIPKFKLSTKENLIPFLTDNGMKSAFDPFKADFFFVFQNDEDKSEDLKLKPRDSIYISQVIHQVAFNLEEKGVEAAGGTSMSFIARGIGGLSVSPPANKLICDRPFLVIVEHTPTNTPLFVCGVQRPVFEE